LAKLWLGLLCH